MSQEKHSSIIGYGFLPQSTSVRAINRARIISLVRRYPGLTRTDLSRLSGLSKATVSTLVTELLSEGLLYEDSKDGGRQRKTSLRLNREAGVAVGFELSPGECRGIVTDMSVRMLRRAQRSLDSNTVQDAMNTILAMHAELLADMALPCLGTVVALPGPTDESGQTLVFSESLGWTDVPLAQMLREKLGCNVSIINRPRAGALGEYWYGAGVGMRDMIYVSISSGIGAGILIAGQIFTGAQGFSSEIGHTTSIIDGPKCKCGNHGCLECIASMPAIIQQIQERIRREASDVPSWLRSRVDDLTYREVVTAARDGNALVLEVIREACQYIGIAVANLIDLFNPSCVIIGGQLAEAGEVVVHTIREIAQRRAFPLSFSGVQIVRSKLGADSVCIGACALVVDRYVAEVEPAMRVNLY